MNFSGDGPAALSAPRKSNEREMMPLEMRTLNTHELGLHLIKQIAADNLFMRSIVVFAEVNHLTNIKPVGKHVAHGIDMDDAAAFPTDSVISEHARNISKRNGTRGKPFERFLHKRRSFWINENGMRFEIVEIPKRCVVGPHTVSQFLPDTALHIFREIIDVIFRLAEGD